MAQGKGNKKPPHPDMEKALSEENPITNSNNTKKMPRLFEYILLHEKAAPGTKLVRIKNKERMNQVPVEQINTVEKDISEEFNSNVVMDSEISDPLMTNVHSVPKRPLVDDDNPPQLNILEEKKEIEEKHEDEISLNNHLTYKYVHLIPLAEQARTLVATLHPHATYLKQMEQAAPENPQTTKTKRTRKNKKRARGKSSTVVHSKKGSGNSLLVPDRDSSLDTTGDAGPSAGIDNIPLFTPDERLQPGVDILITMKLFKPFNYEEYKKKSDKSPYNLLYHDLVLTGRNKVADIKNHFICNDSSKETTHRGGYFIVMNTYYVAFDEMEADHADSLRRRCTMLKMDYPLYNMSTCRLDQLNIKLGNPDVYIHESCDHIIIFSEIRLVHASDSLQLSEYPYIRCKSLQERAPFCYNCANMDPKWIVSACTRVPFNMALYCEQCFKKLLYNENGNKICKFKAYRYKGAKNKKY